jgi:hypothetical protein
MMADEIYVERDDALVRSSVNKPFDELLVMSETEFRHWAESMREEVAKLWREQGVPPISGFTIEVIESQFQAISRYDVADLLVTDELTGRQDCVLANSKIGSACRAFFPNMGKTKDIAGESGKGHSQWDFFTDPNLFELFLKTVRRHFKRDGFYAFSRPIYWVTPAREWIEFHQQHVARGEHKDRDFWFQALSDRTEDSIAQRSSTLSKEERKNEWFELRTRTVSKKDLEELRKLGVISQRHIKNIDFSARDPDGSKVRTLSFQDAKPSKLFWVREYKKGQKIFPRGFRFFQSGLVLSGTNFPSVVAKYLYQRFTEDIKRTRAHRPFRSLGGIRRSSAWRIVS